MSQKLGQQQNGSSSFGMFPISSFVSSNAKSFREEGRQLLARKQKKRPSKIAIQPGHVWTEEVRRRVYVLKQGRRKDRTDHLSWVVKQESIGAV